MPRGYMEGPAAEEAERRAEEAARGKDEPPAPDVYPAVHGCTTDDPEPHFSAGSARSTPTSCSRAAPRGASPFAESRWPS